MSNMIEESDTTEISIISDLSNNTDAQDYVEQRAREKLPDVMDKLDTALDIASKPKDIVNVADTYRSLAQVKKTSDTAALAAGAVMGAMISGKDFGSVFKGMTTIFGVYKNENEREIEDVEIIEVLDENDKDKKVEKVEKTEILPNSKEADDEQKQRQEQEHNPIRF